ncbi:expressed unknown protein [Seminavis robusta]|uniref:Uncharacterized protein n=1 Tax=Seminavis robusta TaxID=568900 RepID=A0A9N8H2T3_9STRA|nr:expressed unknown protein [Seminavis robusta]|eukprot:Sro43_g026130.1 n/a (419) ;mRNA; f:59788-61044
MIETATNNQSDTLEAKMSYESFKGYGSHDLDATGDMKMAANPTSAEFSMNDKEHQMTTYLPDDSLYECGAIPRSGFGLCGATEQFDNIANILCMQDDASRDATESRFSEESDERDEIFKVEVFKDALDPNSHKLGKYWKKVKVTASAAEDRAIAVLERAEKAGYMSGDTMQQVRARKAAKAYASELEAARAKAKAKEYAEKITLEQEVATDKAKKIAKAKAKAAEKAQKKAKAKAKAAAKAAAKAEEDFLAAEMAEEEAIARAEALEEAKARVHAIEDDKSLEEAQEDVRAMRLEALMEAELKKSKSKESVTSLQDLMKSKSKDSMLSFHALKRSKSKESVGSQSALKKAPSKTESFGDVDSLNDRAKNLFGGRKRSSKVRVDAAPTSGASIEDELRSLHEQAAGLITSIRKKDANKA